jgi:dihydrofolate reductase
MVLRKLVMWNMVTLDGFFEGPERGDLDWFLYDDELQGYLSETQDGAGTLVFGRVTYEMMASYWQAAEGRTAESMNRISKVVFSTSLERAEWNNTRLVRGDVADEVARLKRQSGGEIFVFGSADLSATLIAHNLIDEYRLGVHPVLLGRGTPLFKGSPNRLKLRLLEVRSLASGIVILHYASPAETSTA